MVAGTSQGFIRDTPDFHAAPEGARWLHGYHYEPELQ